MRKKNKLKMELIALSVLSAFYPAAFASSNNSVYFDEVKETANLDQYIPYKNEQNPNALLTKSFIEDCLQGTRLNEGAIMIEKKYIETGSCGTVSRAHQNGQKFVAKQPLYCDSIKDLEKEFRSSIELIKKAAELSRTLNNKNIPGILAGLGAIIPVIGKTADGKIIQEDADGNNIAKAIKLAIDGKDNEIFNKDGYPKNLRWALWFLCNFFYALVALHELGYTHNDIKPNNVILTRERRLKLIDLGLLLPIGSPIIECCSITAPEVWSSFWAGTQVNLPLGDETAHTAFDIYCSAGIVLPILFGKKGLHCYTQYLTTSSEQSYIAYFSMNNPTLSPSAIVQKLNQDMKTETGKSYPPFVESTIGNLLTKVLAIQPQDRPSAMDILEVLQELALSNWDDTTRPENARYTIDTRPIMTKQRQSMENASAQITQQ